MVDSIWSDLEGLWDMLQQDLKNRGLLIFPTVVRAPAEAGFQATWPDDDVNSFLDVAVSLGVQVVYADAQRLDESALTEVRARLREAEQALTPEARSFLQEWEERTGEIYAVSLAFHFAGVLHVWNTEATWWRDLTIRLEQQQWAVRLVRVVETNTRVEEVARQLAEEKSLQKAGRRDARERAAWRLLPHLERAFKDGDISAFSLIRQASLRAWEIFEQEIRPNQERAIAQEARRLMASGLPKNQVWGRLGIGREKLD